MSMYNENQVNQFMYCVNNLHFDHPIPSLFWLTPLCLVQWTVVAISFL